MVKLKTFKEIEGIYANGNEKFGVEHTNTEATRKEVIKWIKHIHKKWKQSKNKLPKHTSWQELAEVDCFYLIKFFKLTEKELK